MAALVGGSISKPALRYTNRMAYSQDRDDRHVWLTLGLAILMMMIEHEVHHRSQIDTYAGLQGWPVPDIFGRSAETIRDLQPAQKQKATERAAAATHTE